MPSGKKWTEEDINILEYLWGYNNISSIAKKLGRSHNAVRLKIKRLKLGCFKNAGEYLNANQWANILGVDIHTVTDYWIKKLGLKGKKFNPSGESKYKQTFIRHNDMICFLKKNQNIWDSRRVELYAFGPEPQWLKNKREADKLMPKRRLQKWTAYEDGRLIVLYRKGYILSDIAKELNRSHAAVNHRASRLNLRDRNRSVRGHENGR